MRKLNEYVIVILSLVVILIIMSISLLRETNFFTFFKPSDWLNVIANIFITIFTVGVTIYIFETGDKRERLKNEQENKPILILGVSSYKEIDISNVVDLEDSEVPLNKLKNDSNVEIPLINGGRTPVFNINYFFEIENMEEIKSYYKNTSLENITPKLTFNDKKMHGGEEIEQIIYSYENGNTSYKKRFKVARFLREIPAIMSGKESPINLPTYFIVLLYDYFINPFNNEMPEPICKVFVRYDDFNMERHDEEYLISLARYSTNKNLLNYTLIGSKLNG